MSIHIGRDKAGKEIRAYYTAAYTNKTGQRFTFVLEQGGCFIDEYPSRDEVVKEGKKLLLRSWVENITDQETEDILSSHLKIEYDWRADWAERQREDRGEGAR